MDIAHPRPLSVENNTIVKKIVVISVQSFWVSGIYANRDSMFLMDIEKIIEQGRQGNEAALGSLYQAYHRRMTEICRRIVGDRRVAEELAHDAFLLAFAKIDSLRNPKHFESWLKTITTNVALRYKERHHEPKMIPLSTLTEEDLAQETAQLEEKPLPTMAELTAAVDALPNGYGQVFKLSVIEEMSHKEIAELMGIAAHSSSSQLSRAKKMLQKTLAHYWLLWLLPLLLPIAYFFFKIDKQSDVTTPIVTRQDNNKNKSTNPTSPIVTRPEISIVQRDTTRRVPVVPNIQQSKDSITANDTIPHTIESSDTMTIIINNNPLPEMRNNSDTHIADLPSVYRKEAKSRQSNWSLDMAYSGSIYEQRQYSPFVFEGMVKDESLTSEHKEMKLVDFKKWSDYADYLSEYPDGGDNHDVILNIAKNNACQPGTDEIVRKSHHYMPISWSLALRYKLNSNFWLETGINYSRLKSEFEIGSNGNAFNEQQSIHYLGISLKGLYNIYNGRQWSTYGSMGVNMEIPVYALQKTDYYLNGKKEAAEKSTLNAPLQWSVGTGLGLQYNLTPNLGFFVEPCLQYYIPTGGSIETYRTEHPFTFSVPLGIRITW